MTRQEYSTRTATDSSARLPATLRLGTVHLTVSDLDCSVAFYEDAIGLRLLAAYPKWRGGAQDSRTMSDVASSTRALSRVSPATIRSSILVARAPISRTG